MKLGFFLAALLVLAVSCSRGGSSSPPPIAPELSSAIIYDKHRNGAVAPGIVPILVEAAAGFDSDEVDSPSVVDDPNRVDRFLLYYEATDAAGTISIGVVTSDEETFDVLTIGRTQVIAPTASTDYDFAAADPSVFIDKRAAENAPAAMPSRRYKMWFEGRSGELAGPSTIIYCTSTDGITWTGFTSCTGLDPGTDVSFGVRVADPTVVLDRDPSNPSDLYKMWFQAEAADGHGEIGYAQSTDGIAWTVKDAAGNSGAAAGPVFSTGAVPGFDGFGVDAPCVVLEANGADVPLLYHLWYEAGELHNVGAGGNDIENSLGYATSLDGLTWDRDRLPVLKASSDNAVPLPFDSGDLKHPSALLDLGVPAVFDGHFLLWYTGDGESNASPNRIGFASGRSGP